MIKVFFADDQQLILDELKCIIDWEAKNFTISGEANDGLSAYERICALKPDIVFTDIIMPGMTGIDMLKKIKQSFSSMEVVMLTGYADFSYAKASCRHGAFDYLLKPLEVEELIDTLERFKEKYNVMNNVSETTDISKNPIDNRPLTVPENATLKLFIKYIHENFNNTLNLYEVADNFHFNSSYISQLFKKEMGMSYSEYITRVRMDAAENLLKDKKIPIKTLHTEVGINDYYYFIKLFKKYKGVTPYQMRHYKNGMPFS